jgi:predicted NAD-dependent protein-ADP-ribosyltransferase YbiA (DUF1768 family)
MNKTLLFYTKGKQKEGEKTDKKWDSFSNYYKSTMEIQGKKWKTVEHFFQAMKFNGPGVGNKDLAKEYIEIIRSLSTPNKALILGRIGIKNKDESFRKFSTYFLRNQTLVDTLNSKFLGKINMRSDWEKAKIGVMATAVSAKFIGNPKLKTLLMNIPKGTYIVEHTSRDKIWADGGDKGTGEKGKNYLGKILTALSYILRGDACNEIRNKIEIKSDVPDKKSKMLTSLTKVVCVKVKHIRPEYDNLKEWIDDDKNNLYIGRKGIVFIKKEDGKKERYPKKDSIWANPFKVRKESKKGVKNNDGSREDVINKYRKYINKEIKSGKITSADIAKLKGKNLGCWCSPEPCHGDVLTELIK